jgi:hypothetical protein
MRSPSFEGFSTLREELVPLVYSRNARNRTGLVIKDFVRYVRRNAQPCDPGHESPAQVMQRPTGHSGELIEQSLASAKPWEALDSKH